MGRTDEERTESSSAGSSETGGRQFEQELPNALNFRDLGGIEIAPGVLTRRGLLYRSGRLNRLSDGEVAFLETMGIRRVVDIRSPDEVEAHPDRLPAGTTVLRMPAAEGSLGLESLIVLFRDALEGRADTAEYVTESYRTMPADYAAVFRRLFTILTEDDYSTTLIHCTGGKDRTGLFSALFLIVIGAGEQTVMEDYLLSGRSGADLEAAAARYARQFRQYHLTVPPEMTYPFLITRPEFLHAALTVLHEAYGSPEAYLEQILGVDTSRRELLRTRFLDTIR